MELEAVIFDVDGTLADTERDGHRPAFNAAFAEVGLDWHWNDVLYGELLAITGGKERIMAFAQLHDPDFLARPGVEDAIRDIHGRKTRHYLAQLEGGGIPLRPGIARLLAEARQRGLHLAIATTTTADNVIGLLRANLGPNADGWFEVIGAGDVVASKKPAPDIYHWVLERLELGSGACLALEDSANGLAASLGAGIVTVVLVNEYTRNQAFSGAVAVLFDLGEAGTPCRVLAGDAGEHGLVDVDLLRRWHHLGSIPASGGCN